MASTSMHTNWQDQDHQTLSQWTKRLFYFESGIYSMTTDDHLLEESINDSSQVFKNDKTTTVAKTEVNNRSLIIKRYNARSFGHTLKRAFRRSRALRCWRMSYHFQSSGLNVAKPILMYEKRFGPICLDAYFVNEFLEGEILLDALPSMSETEKNEVARAVTESFEIMKQHRLSHGDMKATNLLWLNKRLIFIDLDAAKKHCLGIFWSWSHRKDRKRFIKNWQDHPDLLKLF